MATRNVSPGGALLRASRVFSLPSPLSRPTGDLSSQATFNSNTATLPYPIHQTITTPETSRLKGDWGFKRPLPLRSTTKTSTPLIRVEAIDTLEHITEFGSAADHSVNLKKWHEMGVPLSTPGIKHKSTFQNHDGPQRSVFEDEIDYTTPIEEAIGSEEVRWKFKGPWLAGQSEGDFNTYLQKVVTQKKRGFRDVIREACAKDITRDSHRRATEQGEEIPPPLEASDISDEELIKYVKLLRHDQTSLYKLVRKFLDLPPSPAKDFNLQELADVSRYRYNNKVNTEEMKNPASPYSESGPPKTHPSAGLSYLRTYSYTSNHPLYGPQKKQPPVKARIVMPKGASTGSFPPTLGVGGFVTDVPSGDTSFKIYGQPSRARLGTRAQPHRTVDGLVNIEPDRVGGSKTSVELKHASIDSKGRIILKVAAGDEEARAVKEGLVHDIPPRRTKPTFAAPTSGYGLSGAGGLRKNRGNSSHRTLNGKEFEDESSTFLERVLQT